MELAERLASYFPGNLAFEATELEEGGTRILLRDPTRERPDGSFTLVAKLDVHEDYVDWKHLSHESLMEPAHKAARELFINEGLYVLCDPADDEARKMLVKHGNWKEVEVGLRWDPDGKA